MKVKCIDSRCKYLTVGKVYEGFKVPLDDNKYIVEGDNGELVAYSTNVFSPVIAINLPPMAGEYKEAAQRMLDNFNAKPITYKDFLVSMPKSASAAVTMYGDGEVIANVYGFEFVCKTEERAEEVYAALITLFKEG